MYRVILENIYDYNYRSFAFCRSCYWTATIFSNIESYECPFCPGEKVELIPLNLNEKYEYELEPNKDLEIKFWTSL
jgi:hypothetical protein